MASQAQTATSTHCATKLHMHLNSQRTIRLAFSVASRTHLGLAENLLRNDTEVSNTTHLRSFGDFSEVQIGSGVLPLLHVLPPRCSRHAKRDLDPIRSEDLVDR